MWRREPQLCRGCEQRTGHAVVIIFLDIDGVLHPETCYRSDLQLCEMRRLVGVLQDFPQTRIVISSTWREKRSLQDLQLLFPPDVQTRVIGLTPAWQDFDHVVYNYHRQAEIEAWLKANCPPWEKFVVLDDSAWLFSPFYAPLLTCDRDTGMDDLVEQRLRDRLAAEYPRLPPVRTGNLLSIRRLVDGEAIRLALCQGKK